MVNFPDYDPNTVTVGDENVPDNWKVCVIQGVIDSTIEYDGKLGARISSIFVILFLSTFATAFPVLSQRVRWLRIPKSAFIVTRQFGAGVILATAFVHLMDPGYENIGPQSCVGMTGNWALYSWPPGIMLFTIFVLFCVELSSEVYVEQKYGIVEETSVEDILGGEGRPGTVRRSIPDQEESIPKSKYMGDETVSVTDTLTIEKEFRTQIAAFFILEFGVIFHSVMIGLTLGTTGDEFSTLYVVIVFHQAFEGLGIGSRLVGIPFPEDKLWWPYALSIAYGITTPIGTAIGLGLRTTYNEGSYNANIIQGVFNCVSAGILIYTGLVEFLARDFLFNPNRPKSIKLLTFYIFCTALGAGLMALLGKWA